MNDVELDVCATKLAHVERAAAPGEVDDIFPSLVDDQGLACASLSKNDISARAGIDNIVARRDSDPIIALCQLEAK